MLARVEVPIAPDDTTGSLEARLAVAGAGLLREVVDRLGRGEAVPEEPQDDDRATLAPKIDKTEGSIDWTRPAQALDWHVRGMQPWPGAFTFVDGQRLMVREATADPRSAGGAAPGSVVAFDDDAIVFACGQDTALRVVRVQPEGKRVMTAREWRLGRRAQTPLRASSAP
jgi:methionyl-tRNA formyltransferase